MALQSSSGNWINAVVGTLATAAVAFVSAVTRQTFTNKSRIEIVSVKQDGLMDIVDKMDRKIDRLVDHLLQKEE
jgi:uncharacterized protein YaaR (DUF327 family)